MRRHWPPAPARLKALLFALCLLPLASIVWRLLLGHQTNPVEFLTRETGWWTLTMLMVTLAVTPLRRLSGWNAVIRLRRMLGLFAFFYVSLHFLTYLWLDQMFDPFTIVHDVVKRPFITVGFAAFAMLVPLALTSTDGWMRRLRRRWGQLHRLVYPIAIAGVVHFWWLVKADIREPALFAMVLGVLLGTRLFWRWRQGRSAVAGHG